MGLFKKNLTSYAAYAFSYYIHSIAGVDTGDGTRNNPKATNTTMPSSTIVLISGFSNSTVSIPYGTIVEGDSDSSGFSESLQFGTNGSVSCIGINLIFKKNVALVSVQLLNCTIQGTLSGNSNGSYSQGWRLSGCFIANLSVEAFSGNGFSEKNTINDYNNRITTYQYSLSRILHDSILYGSVDLYNFVSRANTTYHPIFKNCLFRKATLWKWNGITIPITWSGTGTLMDQVYVSLLAYANALPRGNATQIADSDYAKAILATQATMFQDCVVYDDTNTVSNPIFSKYVGGVPVDYTLALKSNNPALYMSTVGSYVGCYAANVNDDGAGNALTFGAVKHVDTTTGADTATTPDLLIQDGSNLSKFSASQSSTQLWNRIRTSVVAYPRGKSFAGMQSQLDSGIASRLFFGKRQEIRTTGDITQKTTAFESVEVIPYDSIPANNNTTQNTINNMSALLPRFSAPFNGECLMFYKGGVPLLFNALLNLFQGAGTVSITSGSPTVTGTGTAFIADFVAGDNIRINGVDYTVLTTPTSNTSLTLTANVAATLSAQSYYVGVKTDKSTTIYGTWAVTNADIESYSLLQKTTKAGLSTSIPLIKYAKFELNLHYDEE